MSEFEKLKQWIINNGGYIHPGIGIQENDPDNRILISTQRIEENTLIFEIPKQMCITEDFDLSVQPIFSLVEPDIRRISKLYKVFQLGESSFYYLYLSFLQHLDSYKNHPHYEFYYHPEKYEQYSKICNFSKLSEIKITRQKIIKKFFDKVLNLNISDEEILYYELLIMTRCWDKVGFVPFADLFQSTQTSKMFLGNTETHYRLIVDRTYEPNDTIWINYGMFDESLLYTSFGFVDDLEDKRESTSRSMKIFPPNNISTNNLELKTYKEDQIASLSKNHYYISTKGISNSLLAHLRIMYLTESEYELMGDDKNKDFKQIISLENEFHTIKYIMACLFSDLFPTKEMVEESQKIISSYSNNTNKADSIEYNMAKITMYQKDIFKYTFKLAMKGINTMLGIPSQINASYENHHLLD